MTRLTRIMVAVWLLTAGCATNDQGTDAVADSAKTVPSTVAEPATVATTLTEPVDGVPFGVASLGLTFRLPGSFESVDDPDYLFFARSASARSLFTIAQDAPGVTDYAERPGETVSDVDLGNVDAVAIKNAALDGLPEGVSANELLVSNGEDRSFSVIMSGPTADLPSLWNRFVDSVSVTPSDCCSSDPASGRVVGVENACDADIEVTINEDPTVEQPQHSWVLVQPGALETVETIDVPSVAFFVRAPGAAEGQVYGYPDHAHVKLPRPAH